MFWVSWRPKGGKCLGDVLEVAALTGCKVCSKAVSAEATPARKSKSSEALIGESRALVESRVRQP